ncbi:MAG: putative rRNA maturation factor [Rhodothermales bacterium]|jgi:probable rRNA maturation factor
MVMKSDFVLETETVSLVIQRVNEDNSTPTDEELALWAQAAVQGSRQHQITIRLVDELESRKLNLNYRKQDSATNVLSFPASLPEHIQNEIASIDGRTSLGDLVICVPLVTREAKDQSKPLLHHWAHLVIHGILHLLGHDHQETGQAEIMEKLEIDMLSTLGIDNPYTTD